MQNAVRIVVLDYYMSAPIPGLDVTYSEFRAAAVNQLPILRCFGSTENGKKICVHIHGVFPYLYIPYDGKSKPEELMYQIAAALDKAINVSFNQASSSTQHVYKISLVSGIPMYGYHSKTHQFFKIYLYNPALVTKVGSILLNKNILEQVFQPHEIHLNFTLQFMIDYNLHGMSNMLISEMKYRINSDNEISDIDKHLFLPANIEKTSLCELEADINAENIINRQEVLSGNIAINPGITALWEDEKQRRRNKNEDSQLGSFLELKNMFSSPTKTHLIFQQALKERLAVLSTDKDIPKPSPDVSVYPAETPVDSSIQNASFINIQSASSLELSLDDTLSVPYSQDHNETITPDGNSLNVTMDEDAQDFLHLLQELAEEKMMENEEGSILSQTVPEDQSDDSTEDFLDLSMPLASLTTPIKADVGSVNQKSDDEDTDCFNTTLIPQIDGQIECSNIDDEPSSSNKKTMFRYPTISNRSFTNNENAEVMQQTTPVEQKRNSSMPLLNINNITTDFSAIPTSPLNKLNLVPYVKLHRMNVEMAMRIEPLNVKNILKNRRYCSNGKIKHKRAPDDILDDTLRLVRYRMNRINSKSRIKNVGKVLRLNDDYSMNLLKKASCPKFKILPGKKWFLESHIEDVTNNSIINRLLDLTHDYTDPDLHILVKTPSASYLFYYGGFMFPCTIKIPRRLSILERELLCNIYSIASKPSEKNDIIKREKLAFLQKQILNLHIFRKKNHSRNTSIKKSFSEIKNTIIKNGTPQTLSQSVPECLKNVAIKVTKLVKEGPPENLEQVKLNHENIKLRDEIQKADLALGSHLQFLRGFDFITKPLKYLNNSNDIQCLNTKVDETRQNMFCSNEAKKNQGLNNNFYNCNTNCVQENSLIRKDQIGFPIKPVHDNNINYLSKKPIMNSSQGFSNTCYSTDFEVSTVIDNSDQAYTIEKRHKSIPKKEISVGKSSDYLIDTLTVNTGHNSENKLAVSTPTNEIKGSTSSSIDPDYASFEKTSAKNTLYDSESDLSLNLSTIGLKNGHLESTGNALSGNTSCKSENELSLKFSPLNNDDAETKSSDDQPSLLDKEIFSSENQSLSNLPASHHQYKLGTSMISEFRSTSPKLTLCHAEKGVKSMVHPSGNSSEPISDRSLTDHKLKPQINVISNIQLLNPLKIKFVRRRASSIPFRIGTDDGGGDSHTSEKEDSPITDQSDCAKRIRKRRRTVPNMYINCDGAADSSSDDEQTSKRKAIERKLRSSQYMPLGIIVTKSPKVHEKYKEGIEHSLVEISGNCKHSQECASQVSHQDLSNTNIPFKRKLDFEEDAILNSTISEEFISCVYSSNHISNTTQTAKENTIHISQKKRSIVNRHENCNDYKLMEDTKSQSYDSTSSDSDLFLENDDLNKSFFKSYNLTLSEKYDKENKYQPKEGCSTVLSGSISLSNSSIRSQINQVLSSSTSSDIPPYQEISQAKIILRNQSKKIAENIRNNENTDSAGDQKKTKTIKPTFKAPSRLNVALSLTKYKIPHIQQQEPYYSNVDDYTGVVEIGHRVMRIASKTTAHLSEFDSEFNGLNNHRKYIVEHVAHLTWNSNNIKSLKLTHCSTKTVIVQPLKKPPSGNQVKEWIKVNSKPREERTTCSEAKTEPIKMYIPNSPGNDSDLDMSLSLTPYTTSQSSLSDYTEKESTKSLSSFQSTSPALDHRNKKYKNKTLDNKPPDLKDSILLNEKNNNSCQITGISQRNSFGFDKSVQNLQAVRALAQHQYLTTMVMELHIRTRGDLKPDPQFDNICAIFYSILNDVPDPHDKQAKTRGVIAVNCLPIDLKTPKPDLLDGIEFSCDISYVETEEALINNLISVIKFWDPDILAGYETEMLSWGYLVERSFVLSINILPMLGRSQIHKYNKGKLKSLEPELETSIIGRIVLNVWRIMRHEIALQSYTFESIVYHILHRRIPLYAFKELTFWWDHHSNLYRHRAVRYYLQRADTVLELFEKLDFLNRTSELARLFGILFYEVLSRGSQFRVESMMLRLAKPLNYVPVSPDVTQRANMKAPEFIPLVMEPESKLYSDPVIVLDFQSLYPSIIIAYNYCFTTCIGRVNNLGTNYTFEFGATQLKVPKKITEKLCKRDLLNYSPAGVAFVKQKVREGILPRMLKEVLDTRLMVKNSMKENKGNSNLQKVLHNRQLGLKLIANVTYGYTAANFSGRMCCVEVGDSVVSKGRETLQRAIALVESTPEWESRVVYGDTDSMFVLVPGKTKEEAFEIGRKIADAVTADNPDPIKLKLEKVYQPCILQTKKRYVGYMYESPEQKEPIYEAKGIETVRRDGCPAVAKMLQKCLTLLFETKNVSLIKNYVLKQFNKIQTGRASIQDLTFAKEYRGASGYKPGACVPALELAQKWKAVDRRNVPRSGERVPYVIVNGPPGLPLIRLVKSPRDLLNDSSLRPNALYYITKVIIPPINRCLNLIGADLNVWFNQMPRKNTQYLPNSSPVVKNTISQYFATKICASCSAPTQDGLCPRCRQKINVTTLILTEKLRKWEENYNNTLLICQSCTGHLDEIVCTSLDCPVLYRRIQTFNDLQQSTYVRELLADTSIFSEDNFFER